MPKLLTKRIFDEFSIKLKYFVNILKQIPNNYRSVIKYLPAYQRLIKRKIN